MVAMDAVIAEQTADVLERAAEKIEKDGWIKGRLWTEKNQNCDAAAKGSAVCILGAIITVAGGQDRLSSQLAFKQVTENVSPSLGGATQTDGSEISCWNDMPERTVQEVLDVLQLSAKQLRMKI